MKRRVIAIFLALTISLALGACNEKPTGDPTTSSTQKIAAYMPAAKGFESLEEFKEAVGDMQVSARSQNRAFGLSEIWVPVNLPSNAVLEGIGINEYSYILNYRINDYEDVKKSQINLIIDYGIYNDDGSKAEFNNEDLEFMSTDRQLTKVEGLHVYYMNYTNDNQEVVGKMHFYSFEKTRVKLYIPLTAIEEMVEANLNPFELTAA